MTTIEVPVYMGWDAFNKAKGPRRSVVVDAEGEYLDIDGSTGPIGDAVHRPSFQFPPYGARVEGRRVVEWLYSPAQQRPPWDPAPPMPDRCPHCGATPKVPLSSGLSCTNDWHRTVMVCGHVPNQRCQCVRLADKPPPPPIRPPVVDHDPATKRYWFGLTACGCICAWSSKHPLELTDADLRVMALGVAMVERWEFAPPPPGLSAYPRHRRIPGAETEIVPGVISKANDETDWSLEACPGPDGRPVLDAISTYWPPK